MLKHETQVKINVQLYPTKKRLVPKFKVCKVIAHLSKAQYERMVVDGKQRKILEKRNHKRYGEVVTVYRISNADGIEHITSAMIYRGLTGKVSKGGKGKMTIGQRDAILNSVKKLMSTIIKIDESETNPALNYGKDRAPITCSAILPAYFVEKTVNGQDASVVYFDSKSPLMTIARDRKQLLQYDVSLLDKPKDT